jgi:hypothetical protein
MSRSGNAGSPWASQQSTVPPGNGGCVFSRTGVAMLEASIDRDRGFSSSALTVADSPSQISEDAVVVDHPDPHPPRPQIPRLRTADGMKLP